jgi:hypothetical protein
VVSAPANRHDSPLLAPTTLEALGLPPEPVSMHLDRGYDSEATRLLLEERGLDAVISQKGKPAPMSATKRWVVEWTNSWHNAHKKLVWCAERREPVIDSWVSFSFRTWSSSWGGSSEKPGAATAGKPDPPEGRDLLAEPLSRCTRR